jgi:hypothetical protein
VLEGDQDRQDHQRRKDQAPQGPQAEGAGHVGEGQGDPGNEEAVGQLRPRVQDQVAGAGRGAEDAPNHNRGAQAADDVAGHEGQDDR